MRQNQAKIRAAIKALRRRVDAGGDVCAVRLAYAMECALRWATEDTVGWQKPVTEAELLAIMLRQELRGEPERTP